MVESKVQLQPTVQKGTVSRERLEFPRLLLLKLPPFPGGRLTPLGVINHSRGFLVEPGLAKTVDFSAQIGSGPPFRGPYIISEPGSPGVAH